MRVIRINIDNELGRSVIRVRMVSDSGDKYGVGIVCNDESAESLAEAMEMCAVEIRHAIRADKDGGGSYSLTTWARQK